MARWGGKKNYIFASNGREEMRKQQLNEEKTFNLLKTIFMCNLYSVTETAFFCCAKNNNITVVKCTTANVINFYWLYSIHII